MSAARTLGKSVFAAGDLFRRNPTGPRLLIYHQVGTDHGHQMEVTTENFVRQLDWLASEREVVDLTSAVQRWDEPGSDRLTVLTFDDGYRDVYTTAFPILLERRMPFILYLTTSLIADGSDPSDSADPRLSWHQVAEMIDSGLMAFGAHTHNHPDLRELSREQVATELEISDDIIETRLGRRSEHFAYPYGFWSESADYEVRQRYSTAVLGGAPAPASTPDPHLLHRYPVQLSDGFRFFKARVKSGLRLEESLRRRLKGYEGP